MRRVSITLTVAVVLAVSFTVFYLFRPSFLAYQSNTSSLVLSAIAVAPDGTRVATEWRLPSDNSRNSAHIAVFSLPEGVQQGAAVPGLLACTGSANWSPDSAWFVFLEHRQEQESNARQVAVMGRNGDLRWTSPAIQDFDAVIPGGRGAPAAIIVATQEGDIWTYPLSGEQAGRVMSVDQLLSLCLVNGNAVVSIVDSGTNVRVHGDDNHDSEKPPAVLFQEVISGKQLTALPLHQYAEQGWDCLAADMSPDGKYMSLYATRSAEQLLVVARRDEASRVMRHPHIALFWEQDYDLNAGLYCWHDPDAASSKGPLSDLVSTHAYLGGEQWLNLRTGGRQSYLYRLYKYSVNDVAHLAIWPGKGDILVVSRQQGLVALGAKYEDGHSVIIGPLVRLK